jgi:enamine deaminase RidA (YjgF/YER057c/UK114 family)
VKEQIHVAGLESEFHPYPAAVKQAGLVLVSGVRSTGAARSAALADMRKEPVTKGQGYTIADHDEAKVSIDSWATHANLEMVLRSAGSSGEQILRQHIWQRDKRFFPCYERVRVHFQPTPAPSSGLGVAEVTGNSRHWIGIDAIAVAPGENPEFTARSVVAAVDNRDLPAASHYSQAVRSGDLVFTAGHIAIKTGEPGKPLVNSYDDIPPEGRFLATGRSHPDSRDGPIAAQSWYIYNELKKLLGAGGLSFSDVVLSTVYLADVRDFAVFHRIHHHFFPQNSPALAVSGFNEVGHRGCRIEIELTALAPASKLKRSGAQWSIPAPVAAPAGVSVGPITLYSGMLGLDHDGRLVGGADCFSGGARAFVQRLEEIESKRGLAAQCWAAFERLAEAVKTSGSRMRDLLKMTVYLSNPVDFRIFEAVRPQFIDDADLPALERVCVFGPGPVADAVVQIEAIGCCGPA